MSRPSPPDHTAFRSTGHERRGNGPLALATLATPDEGIGPPPSTGRAEARSQQHSSTHLQIMLGDDN
jgi:hypothetical protein